MEHKIKLIQHTIDPPKEHTNHIPTKWRIHQKIMKKAYITMIRSQTIPPIHPLILMRNRMGA